MSLSLDVQYTIICNCTYEMKIVSYADDCAKIECPNCGNNFLIPVNTESSESL
ncbi:MAG: hypothetical protein Q8934_19775 [Bacillota bacterium]|nr:hypothetical protein [Bacillota bacterium]